MTTLLGIPRLSHPGETALGALPILLLKDLEPDWLRYNTWLATLPRRERARRMGVALAATK